MTVLGFLHQNHGSKLQHDCNYPEIYIDQKSWGPSGARLLGCGPSGRLWALRACLITSFTPFGRSGRVTHTTADDDWFLTRQRRLSAAHRCEITGIAYSSSWMRIQNRVIECEMIIRTVVLDKNKI